MNGALADRIGRMIENHGEKIVRPGDFAALGDEAEVSSALALLEESGRIEQFGPGIYRVLHPECRPQLSFSRIWSNPRGVSDEVFIATVLANPSFTDIARLCLAYGVRRVCRVLDSLEAGYDIQPEIKTMSARMIANAERGFREVAPRLPA